jgi:thymidine phosphorylase
VDEAGLSEVAWRLLGAEEGDIVLLSHPPVIESLRPLRAKVYGHALDDVAIQAIISDIAHGRYSDIELSAFITACAGGMDMKEIVALTKAMVNVGERLHWDSPQIVDKHCIGGLPGNRTTLIVVPIVAAYGLTMPKTSSRAITSPAGTADVMETLTRVDLDIPAMRRVVEREGGCVIWGGAMRLSPADDILIRVERPLDIDSEGQLVASVLSKKAAAGSSHVVIDIPVGETAKVRSPEAAVLLGKRLTDVGRAIGLHVHTILSDGSQPVGRGIGPALEAWDVLAVLQGKRNAPADLRERALTLAGHILEFAPDVAAGEGIRLAREILDDGRAWKKFQAICEAQGGLQEPRRARYTHDVLAQQDGQVKAIDNRRLARIAKLAGAPHAKSAGLKLHTPLGNVVEKSEPLFTIHAETPGELDYALDYVNAQPGIITISTEA